jgi:hypothetical protein
MKIYDANNQELMQVRAIAGEDGNLVIRGKIFGAMPMVAKLTPGEARAALRLLDFKTFVFLLTMLFRR